MTEKAKNKEEKVNKVDSIQTQKTRVNKLTGSFIYVGPSLKDLKENSIFRGEPPQSVSAVLAKNPAAKALFVPVAKLGETKNKISTKGSRESQLYKRAAEFDHKDGDK